MENKVAVVIAGNFIEEENADPYMLLNYLPKELVGCCDIKEWSRQPSTYYSMTMTVAMEDMFENLADEGYKGIIVVCGSGVMEEMAYIVSLLWQRRQPVVFANLLVCGKRGVEQGLMNLSCAVKAALSDKFSGVLLCSSGEIFDASDVTLADPASEDSAFCSFVGGAVGKILNDDLVVLRKTKHVNFLARRPKELPAVEILWASIGAGDRVISALSQMNELKGLILAGFGSGNIPPSWVSYVRNILRRRIPVGIASRCLISSVHVTSAFEGSYEKLLEMEVMSCGTLTPLKARIKMSLGLASGLTKAGLALYLLDRPVDDDTPELYI